MEAVWIAGRRHTHTFAAYTDRRDVARGEFWITQEQVDLLYVRERVGMVSRLFSDRLLFWK